MKGEGQERHLRGRRSQGKEQNHHSHSRHKGAKTFRRGRAISFLETMYVKRKTIMKQLGEPEFQSIQPILVGELKALDTIIDEFKQQFEIDDKEIETINKENGEGVEYPSSKESLDKNEE